MNRKKKIQQKLEILNPHILKITNNSSEHKNHSGNPNNSLESHFTIEIFSDKLSSLSRIEQHRTINSLLEEEFDKGLHALSIKILTNK